MNGTRNILIGALIGAVLAVLWFLTMAPRAQGAGCADPVSYNSPLIWRSLSGVEVDWSYGVKPGCTSTFRVQVLRQDTVNPDDPYMRSHYQSPTYTFDEGDYVTNVLISTPQDVTVVLWVGGKVYNLITVDPGAVE